VAIDASVAENNDNYNNNVLGTCFQTGVFDNGAFGLWVLAWLRSSNLHVAILI
jgi:hypothetical protein